MHDEEGKRLALLESLLSKSKAELYELLATLERLGESEQMKEVVRLTIKHKEDHDR